MRTLEYVSLEDASIADLKLPPLVEFLETCPNHNRDQLLNEYRSLYNSMSVSKTLKYVKPAMNKEEIVQPLRLYWEEYSHLHRTPFRKANRKLFKKIEELENKCHMQIMPSRKKRESKYENHEEFLKEKCPGWPRGLVAQIYPGLYAIFRDNKQLDLIPIAKKEEPINYNSLKGL